MLTFANSETQRLPSLMDEYVSLNDLLRDRAARGDFRVVSFPIATREQVAADIQAYEQEISLFLFSGHAGSDCIQLEDGLGQAGGVAAMLGRCSHLKVVVLNGCSTAGQVHQLLQSGVPVVVATSAPVGDAKATVFSKAFFRSLSRQSDSILDAFNKAMSEVKFYGKVNYNDLEARGLGSVAHERPLWGIYYYENNGVVAQSWKLDSDFTNAGQTISSASDQSGAEQKALNYQVRKFIENGKIKDAIVTLISCKETEQDATILMDRFKKLERDDRLCLISNSESILQRARLADAVLRLSSDLHQ